MCVCVFAELVQDKIRTNFDCVDSFYPAQCKHVIDHICYCGSFGGNCRVSTIAVEPSFFLCQLFRSDWIHCKLSVAVTNNANLTGCSQYEQITEGHWSR